MNTRLNEIEVRMALLIQRHDLAVENGRVGGQFAKSRRERGKAAGEALGVACPHIELGAVLHDNGTHAVELQFEQPILVVERFFRKRRQHRLAEVRNWRPARFLHPVLFEFALDWRHPLFARRLLANFVHELSGDDGFGPLFGDIDIRRGVVIANLKEDPLPRVAAAAHEHPLAFEFLSVKKEVELSLFPSFFRCGRIHHVIRAVVPNDDLARAIVAFWNHAFEITVIDGMIFGQHGEALLGGVQTGTLRNGPRAEHAFHFEPEIVVQPRGVMLLNDEAVAALLFYFARRFGGLIELPLPFIFVKAHLAPIISGMGRMRIKKKEAVLPFRETLAYRMGLVIGSALVFVVALYILVGAVRAGTIVSMIASGVIGIAGAFGTFYNLDHLREAKIPKQTLNRMKRR